MARRARWRSRDSGKLAAGNALTLSGRNIDNTATGDIQGYATALAASDTITNRGVIDGVVTRIDAATLTNIGTGRIYGDQISIGAGTLNNLAETVNGVTSTASIAARARLDIGAQTINNRDGSLIFSEGDLAIGGSLGANGRATGAAATLNNHASTIEATRDASISTAILNNTNGGVTWALQPGASQHVVEYALPGSATRYPASEVLLAVGGYLLTNSTGWNNWLAADASNPLAPANNAAVKLLVPSPDYPLERFRAYYLQSPANSADRSYQTCNVDTCETTAMPGAWYAISDPIWATFGVAPPAADLPASHPGRIDPNITVGQEGLTTTVDGPSGPTTVMLQRFDHPVTQAEYDQWQAYRGAHQALDAATLSFIHTITGVVSGPNGESKSPRLASIYDAFDYTVTGSTAVLQSSAPARILAGGAMNINVGSGTNDMSQILAGGALTVTGGTIANVGLMVDAPTVQTGTAIHSYVQNDNRTYQFAPYNLTTYSTVTLAAARQEGNASISGSGTGTGSLALGQTSATAQGAGGVQGARVNPIVQVPSAVGGVGRANGGAAGMAGAAAGATGTPVSGSIPMVVRTSTPNAAIPTASLFRTHPEPASRYLVETDPRFANYRQWLSSDYLLNALGSDPNLVQKRLGDGFYEQRLIREQVAQLTGYRYLDGFESDEAQYAALMNAGVTFAKEYGLRPGVALTAAQMAQLTSDIVWLVEQEVTLADSSTQKVLVPQVYVRVKEGDIDGSGALLAGNSVDMQLAGDLTTAGGTIAGRRAVVISAENINNLAGRITGQDAVLTARQDLNVIGGTIDAGNSLEIAAGRDINVVTTTRDSRSDSGMLFGSDAASGVKLAAVTLDRVAGLYVTNPGGSLEVHAKRDMNLVGAEVKSAGDAALAAGRDMNLDSVTTGRAEDIRWSDKNSREGQQSQETGTTISGAGSVSLTAGRDLTARAATLSAGQTLSLDAGGKLTLYAGENQTSAETHHATGKGMTRYSLDADSQDTSLARTTLNATDIQLRSGGDMTLSAIDATGESLAIDAGGKLNLLTQTTTSAASARERDDDAAFSSASGNGRTDDTTQYNRFNVKDLSIKADGGVKAQFGQYDSLATLAQQPGMAWVNQLVNDPAFVNSVEWQRVKEEHDRWSYHQSGMGPVTALVVSVVVGVATAGAGTSVMGASATAYPATTAAIQAGITTMASRATVSLANNDGDLGKVLKELGSSEGIKAIVTSMLTAGAIQGLSTSGLLPENLANATDGSARFTDQLQRQLIDGVASSVVRSAVNGTSLEDELRDGLVNALLNTAAAQGAFQIGQWTSPGIDPVTGAVTPPALNRFAGEVAHAIVGCMAGAARTGNGDGCAPGAVGAVVGHMTAGFVNPTGDPSRATDTLAWSQLMGAIAGGIVGGDVKSIDIAGGTAGNAVQNNYLTSQQWRNYADELGRCDARGCTPEERQAIRESYQQLSTQQNVALANCNAVGNCAALGLEVAEGTQTMVELNAAGRLPGGAVGNDLGQYTGQRLANDPAYRETVRQSIEVLNNCNANPGQCTQQAINAAALVVFPLLGPAGVPLTFGRLAIGGSIGAAANVGGQLFANGGQIGQVNPSDAGMAAYTGALTYGATFWPSLFVNTGGAVTTSAINNNPSASSGSIAGAAFGTAIGYPLGAAAQGGLNAVVNPWYRPMWQDAGLTIQQWIRASPLPGSGGAAVGSFVQEVGNAAVNSPAALPSAGNPTRGGR